jgi:hypothetical protein
LGYTGGGQDYGCEEITPEWFYYKHKAPSTKLGDLSLPAPNPLHCNMKIFLISITLLSLLKYSAAYSPTTEALLQRGFNVVSTTRSGNDPFKVIKLPSAEKDLYSFGGAVDVTKPEDIVSAISTYKPSHVVYAASASKKGGNAKEVDYRGVLNAAEAVSSTKGVKLELISALAVDQTESKGYKMTNSMGGVVDGIMDFKRMGEDEVRGR